MINILKMGHITLIKSFQDIVIYNLSATMHPVITAIVVIKTAAGLYTIGDAITKMEPPQEAKGVLNETANFLCLINKSEERNPPKLTI